MKRRICALVAALLLLGAASAAPLPEGMTYLAACRVEGETTDRHRAGRLLEKLGMIDQGDGPNDWDAY